MSAGRDPLTGDHKRPKLELTRLTIPRRVYTQAHMDVVAESVKACFDARASTRGLRMVYEPTYLRFFQARFEPHLIPGCLEGPRTACGARFSAGSGTARDRAAPRLTP